jgi:hypothetical protein
MMSSNKNISQDDLDKIMNELSDLDVKLLQRPDDEELQVKKLELKKKLKDDYEIDYDVMLKEDE